MSLEFAGEAVDEHFAAGHAVGEVEKRGSGSGFAIEIDAGGGVETALAEAHAKFVCLAHDIGECELPLRSAGVKYESFLETNGSAPVRLFPRQHSGGHFRDAIAQPLAGVDGGGSVEIGRG